MTSTSPKFDTIVDALSYHASARGEAVAFRYLDRGERECDSLSYSGLEGRASGLAQTVLQHANPGDRVCLVLPSGLESIVALFACFLSGLTAVPLHLPRPNRSQHRMLSVIADCECKILLTTAALKSKIEEYLQQMPDSLHPLLLAVDECSCSETGSLPTISKDHIALVQYTSGSTATPRGVIITHGNLIANQRAIRSAFDNSQSTVGISWLPLHHDMGLIGMVIQPVFLGCETIHMSPLAFIQRPVRWLRAISQYHGTTSGGPNFAYQLCADRLSDEQCEGLDLSSWKLAFNGAEPVRTDTMLRFYERFRKYGLHRDALYSCYGMAEATLFISGTRLQNAPAVPAESTNRIASSGVVADDTEVRIVDPASLQPVAEGVVGEVWVQGPGVGAGYWNRPDLTATEFNARMADERGSGPYLRTGDLGYLDNGHLFVCGRLKEMLIVRGQNIFPVDLEAAVANSSDWLQQDKVVAFSRGDISQEDVVVTAEIKAYKNLTTAAMDEIISLVRGNIAAQFDLTLRDIVMLRPGGIPRTSSGKVKRLTCRDLYLKGELKQLEITV